MEIVVGIVERAIGLARVLVGNVLLLIVRVANKFVPYLAKSITFPQTIKYTMS